MAITRKSKIKEIVANTDALAIVNKYLPGIDPTEPKLKPTMGMSLKALCAFPQTGISKDKAKELFEELEEANIE
ncbi:MAG: hypothetical protein ACOWWH_10620 [Eubacteriaceae bacterium]